MVEELAPLHERRAQYAARPDDAMAVLETGSQRAREVAQATMAEVRDALHL
jgi:tryptophanyl-tRNA synthetase